MRVPNVRKFKFDDYDKRNHEVRDLGKVEKLKPLKVDFSNLDEKKKRAYVKGIKMMIRGSLEYREFISYLKESLDMNECTFFDQINTKKRNIRIEIHHEPFRLEDLVFIAIEYFIRNGYEVEDYAIAEFVLAWHYSGIIGLIPLSKTVHELTHAGKIFIPVFYPFGDIAKFHTMYKDYMSDNQKTQFEELIRLSQEFENKPPDVLRKRFVYLKVDGFELPESF